MGKLFNRAMMTVSGTPGTGAITLGGAVSGYQTFAAAGIANGDVVSYIIEDGTNWEYGQGTYTTSGTSLARTTIQGSSNSGSAISVSSSARVFASALASDIVTPTSSETISGSKTFSTAIASSVTSSSVWNVDATGTSTGPIAAAGTYTFQAGAGEVLIDDVTNSGQAAKFLIAGGVSVLIAQTGTVWANAVTANKYSLIVSGASIVLTNSTGNTVTFQIWGVRIRSVAN